MNRWELFKPPWGPFRDLCRVETSAGKRTREYCVVGVVADVEAFVALCTAMSTTSDLRARWGQLMQSLRVSELKIILFWSKMNKISDNFDASVVFIIFEKSLKKKIDS